MNDFVGNSFQTLSLKLILKRFCTYVLRTVEKTSQMFTLERFPSSFLSPRKYGSLREGGIWSKRGVTFLTKYESDGTRSLKYFRKTDYRKSIENESVASYKPNRTASAFAPESALKVNFASIK